MKKTLLFVIASVLALSGCSKKQDAQNVSAKKELTKFTVGHLNSTAHLLAFVAKEEGYFAEEGLDASLIQFASSVPSITFQSNGHDLSIFGGAMTNGHGYVIKSKYTGGKDNLGVQILKGRNVASVKNSVQDAELLLLLKNANIEVGEGEDKVNIIYFDSQKDAFNALQNNSIDACSVYSPYASLAKGQGYNVVYYCSNEPALENQPCCRQVAPTSALSKNADVYLSFERALIKAYKFYQDNHSKTIADVKKYIDIDQDYIETEVYGGYSLSSPDPDKQGTKNLKDVLVNLGYTSDYDIDKFYNTSIFEKALGSLISENPSEKVYAELKNHFEKYE